jgi:hypothetical protein
MTPIRETCLMTIEPTPAPRDEPKPPGVRLDELAALILAIPDRKCRSGREACRRISLSQLIGDSVERAAKQDGFLPKPPRRI